MKATELMIGDWMQFADGNKKCTVVGIKCDARYLEEEAIITVMDRSGHWFNKEMDYLKPIPLTAEFFDRNGWHCIESEKYGKRYGLYDDYYEMTAHEFNDGMWRVEYDCIEMGGIPIECVNIGWVHEFQHFLSHCAVDMEFKLED